MQQYRAKETPLTQAFTKTISIHAPVSKIWNALTDPSLMKQWMTLEEIDIITDWQPSSSIIIKGKSHWVYFENKGTVLQFRPQQLLQYSHLSSLSGLPDEPMNYTLLEFKLMPIEDNTTLTLTISNFPTESIYRHFVFYWNVTLELLRKFIENTIFATE